MEDYKVGPGHKVTRSKQLIALACITGIGLVACGDSNKAVEPKPKQKQVALTDEQVQESLKTITVGSLNFSDETENDIVVYNMTYQDTQNTTVECTILTRAEENDYILCTKDEPTVAPDQELIQDIAS